MKNWFSGLTQREQLSLLIMGLAVALWTVRAKKSWLLFTLIPLFANASLLLVPWLARQWTSGA